MTFRSNHIFPIWKCSILIVFHRFVSFYFCFISFFVMMDWSRYKNMILYHSNDIINAALLMKLWVILACKKMNPFKTSGYHALHLCCWVTNSRVFLNGNNLYFLSCYQFSIIIILIYLFCVWSRLWQNGWFVVFFAKYITRQMQRWNLAFVMYV